MNDHIIVYTGMSDFMPSQNVYLDETCECEEKYWAFSKW